MLCITQLLLPQKPLVFAFSAFVLFSGFLFIYHLQPIVKKSKFRPNLQTIIFFFLLDFFVTIKTGFEQATVSYYGFYVFELYVKEGNNYNNYKFTNLNSVLSLYD